MKLRTTILFTLLLFAVVPTLLFLAFSLPLMLDRLQSFYQQAHLQTLRADFRDLDEHLASRREMTRILAKLPEPGILMSETQADSPQIEQHRARYAEWINAVFGEQFDVVSITFLDRDNQTRFWLKREQADAPMAPSSEIPRLPDNRLLQNALKAKATDVLVSPVHTTEDEQGRPHPLLHLVAPIYNSNSAPTAVVISTIDISGLANAYRSTLWVDADGRYIGSNAPGNGNAFDDYAGLDNLFSQNRLGLWKDPVEGQIIWVPLFRAADGEPLWVGRVVGQSPIASLWQNLLMRGILIAIPVLIGIWLVARKVSKKVGEIGRNLSDGVRQIVEEDKEANFTWKRPLELREVSDNLNRLSQTHARNQRNLLSHTRELEESNRFKSEFLANVSHELKTPLNSILVLSKLIKENPQLDKDSHEQAQVIHKAGKDLHGLIENILELSMLERMDQSVSLEELNLEQLVSDTIELMRPQYEEKGLTLNYAFKQDAARHIISDGDKIKQILRNLLSNALKFTHSGGATITVSTANGSNTQQPVSIAVCDTGMGIPAEQQQRIFDAFRQADGSIRRRFGGTGLGLNISQRLAVMIGGTLNVTSTSGAGACFLLCLPLEYIPGRSLPETATLETSPEPTTASTDTHIDYRGRHVLIIDDDVDHLLQLSRILSQWNIDMIAASDEDEIREAITDNPDCILTLVNIDHCRKDNCDSIGTIDAGGFDCKLVAVTDPGEELDDSLKQHFEDVMQAPFDANRLKTLIDKQLGS